jgi:hypothetical protein
MQRGDRENSREEPLPNTLKKRNIKKKGGGEPYTSRHPPQPLSFIFLPSPPQLIPITYTEQNIKEKPSSSA